MTRWLRGRGDWLAGWLAEATTRRAAEEEARAERNQRAAERKAQQMLEARSRHYQELLGKIQFYEEQQNERQAQRAKNNYE